MLLGLGLITDFGGSTPGGLAYGVACLHVAAAALMPFGGRYAPVGTYWSVILNGLVGLVWMVAVLVARPALAGASPTVIAAIALITVSVAFGFPRAVAPSDASPAASSGPMTPGTPPDRMMKSHPPPQRSLPKDAP